MHLTKKQEEILVGEDGDAAALAMQIVTRVGEAYGASELVPIASSHVLAHYGSLHDAGIEMHERFVRLKARFAVPTTVNPASVDLEHWRELGFHRKYAAKQNVLCRTFARMGGIPSWSCIHYQYCNVPRFGQCLAWCESSAVCFANSVIGARSNRLTAGLDLACAILGLTPKFGLLLDEARAGQVLVTADASELDDVDYQLLGHLIGKSVANKIPVIEGLPSDIGADQLKALGAAAASSGSVAMYHAVGITPEAKTRTAAFQGAEPIEHLSLTRKDFDRARDELTTSGKAPDLVALGGPQYSMHELIQISNLLKGRKVKRGIKFWIYTTKYFDALAKSMGIKGAIEKTGAKITTSTCAEVEPIHDLGFRTVMTSSSKFANLIPAEHKVGIRFASNPECVRVATEK